MPAALQRFLVNRETGDVWIWTQRLAESYPQFEEVFARDAKEAKIKRAMPDPRTVSIAQLEDMSKNDLILFATVKMEPAVSTVEELEKLTKDEIRDRIKEELFTRPQASG